jgi:hypothetical protein
VEKAISITNSESVFLALGILHVLRMCHVVLCGLSGGTMFFPHYVKKGPFFGGGELLVKIVSFDFSTTFL